MFKRVKKSPPFLLTVVLLASILRLVNLGYSDYQGDEIKALFLPNPGQPISDFLLNQRKGPIQFGITYLLKFIDPSYSNQFITRLPFAVAGILSVYFFYKFLKLHFNEKTAFYASFFLATNGFLVAFSRIVQYQSYVVLFMILSLYLFSLAVKSKEWEVKGIYLGYIFWAFSILSHYDGVFIFPFVLYLVIAWLRRETIKIFALKNIKHLLIAKAIFASLLLSFYIPFVTSIDIGTKSYWKGRIVGTGGKISSSTTLFRVYQPIYVIHIYTVVFAFGVLKVIKEAFSLGSLGKFFILKIKGLPLPLLLFLDDKFQKLVALVMWFFIPFIFLEVFIDIPGTHIYTYLIPVMIFLGLGIAFLEQLFHLIARLILKSDKLRVYLSSAFLAGVLVVFSFVFVQSYAVFVDNNFEYPWQNEKFFVWEFHKPSPIFHLSMFGFPYYRNWDGIGEFVRSDEVNYTCTSRLDDKSIKVCPNEDRKVEFYSTNERKSIARYHIPYPKDTDSAGYYVLISNAQSFTDNPVQDKALYWAENYEPVFIVDRCLSYSSAWNVHYSCKSGRDIVVKVYYMPQGSLDEIREAGY